MRKLLIILNATCLVLLLCIVISPSYAQGQSSQAKDQAKNATAAGSGNKGGGQQVTIGNVEGVEDSMVIVEEKKGKKIEALVDSTTQILGQGKKPLGINQIKPKDRVAVVSSSSANASDEGKPKKAIKIFVAQSSSSSAQSKRRAIQGLITGINGAVITIVHQVQQDRFFNLLTNAQTLVKIKGVLNATLSDLRPGMRVAAVGDLNEQGVLVAKRIHVIPGKAKGLTGLIPSSTPSATLSPTPQATISATPSATPTLTKTPTPTATVSATPTP